MTTLVVSRLILAVVQLTVLGLAVVVINKVLPPIARKEEE